jgi:hypothetical protein
VTGNSRFVEQLCTHSEWQNYRIRRKNMSKESYVPRVTQVWVTEYNAVIVMSKYRVLNVLTWKRMDSKHLGTVISQWYSAGLWTGWSGVRVPAEVGNFSLHYHAQAGSGAHPASYPMGARGSFPGGKADGAWSWPVASISVEVNAWSYTSTPQYAFVAWCWVKVQGQLWEPW